MTTIEELDVRFLVKLIDEHVEHDKNCEEVIFAWIDIGLDCTSEYDDYDKWMYDGPVSLYPCHYALLTTRQLYVNSFISILLSAIFQKIRNMKELKIF